MFNIPQLKNVIEPKPIKYPEIVFITDITEWNKFRTKTAFIVYLDCHQKIIPSIWFTSNNLEIPNNFLHFILPKSFNLKDEKVVKGLEELIISNLTHDPYTFEPKIGSNSIVNTYLQLRYDL